MALTGGVAARTKRESTITPEKVPLWRRLTFALAAPTFVTLLLVGMASVNLSLLEWLDRTRLLPEYTHPPGGGLPEISFLLAIFVLTGLLMGRARASRVSRTPDAVCLGEALNVLIFRSVLRSHRRKHFRTVGLRATARTTNQLR